MRLFTCAQPPRSPMPDWLLRALSDLPSDHPVYVSVKPSSISAVPSQLRLTQTPREEDEESVFAFAPLSFSPPPSKLASLMTSTPQPTHASLPTFTSARSHSKCSQLSTLTTCNVPIIPNRISTSVSPPSSPFPVSPALLSSFHANTSQRRTSQPESPQSHEYLPPPLSYCCPQVVDIVNGPSDPDPVGRIWRQERDIAQKERTILPSRVCKLSLLQPFKHAPTPVVLPNNFIDAGPVAPDDTGRLWIPSFPDAKIPNHRIADPGRSQLRKRDFLGSADPIITPQVIAAEAASAKGNLHDVDGCPTIASKVKFWIPDIHSSPFSAARSFVTISPADIHSEATESLSHNVDIAMTLGKLGETHQQSGVLGSTWKIAGHVERGPSPFDVPQVS